MPEEKLGLEADSKDFEEMVLEETPTFEKYKDGSVEGTPDETPEELEPTPDLSPDVNLNLFIVFPKEDRIDREKVVRHKREINGNPIGRKNQNPILDTCQYEEDFTDGEVTELTSNVIDERMYAQCDKYGNAIFLLDSFVDYRMTDRELFLQDQKLTVNGKLCMKRLTAVWEICGIWKYQSTNW